MTQAVAGPSLAPLLARRRELVQLDLENCLSKSETSEALAIDLQLIGSRRAFYMVLPWIAAMAVIISVASLASGLAIPATGAGSIALELLLAAVAFAGITLTVSRGLRAPPVRYRLLLGPTYLALWDARVGSLIDEQVREPSAVRLMYHYRGGTFRVAALRLSWPSMSLVLGIWDASFAWSSDTARTRRLDYLVGSEEWRRLVSALRLGCVVSPAIPPPDSLPLQPGPPSCGLRQ